MSARKKTAALAVLLAMTLVNGCTDVQSSDPLAGYGADSTLPQLNREPTEVPCTLEPQATPVPAAPTWAELPLDEGEDAVASGTRPTRRPTPAAMDVQLSEFIRERQTSEHDNAGTLQANVVSPGMAVEIEGDDGYEYTYFTAANGHLYRFRRVEGASFSPDINSAERVSNDCAKGLIVSLKGELLYVCGSDLIKLSVGENVQRTVLCSFDEISSLTRWDDMVFFVARSGDSMGVYRVMDGGSPEEIIQQATAVQLDVVERRIVALDESGLKAYTLDGDAISPIVECAITAFCYSGGSLYYSNGSSIYRYMSGGTVECVLSSGASWLGCVYGNLFYINADDGCLRRAELDGTNDRAVSTGEAFNPTLLSDCVAYGIAPNTGLTDSAEY